MDAQTWTLEFHGKEFHGRIEVIVLRLRYSAIWVWNVSLDQDRCDKRLPLEKTCFIRLGDSAQFASGWSRGLDSTQAAMEFILVAAIQSPLPPKG